VKVTVATLLEGLEKGHRALFDHIPYIEMNENREKCTHNTVL
jgi:hypothetical protein